MKFATTFWLFILTFLPHCVSSLSAQREAWHHLSTNSSTRTQLGEELRPEQRLALNQVADSMLDVYQLLAHMRSLDPSGIEVGPHNQESDTEYCRQQNVSVSAMYLYQVLPYINEDKAGHVGFNFDRGMHVDLHYKLYNHLLRGRSSFDPSWQSHPKRIWLRPLLTVGSGDDELAIVFDYSEDRTRIVDGPYWQSVLALPNQRERMIEFPELPSTENGFGSTLDSPAAKALCAVMQGLLNLDLTPALDELDRRGGDIVDLREHDVMKTLYGAAGWPHDFDGDGFEVSLARYQAREFAKEALQQPRRDLENELGWYFVEKGRAYIRRLENEINASASHDPEYLRSAKLEVWDARSQQERLEQEHAKAWQRYRRYCPNGDCLDPARLLLAEVEKLGTELALAWKSDREPPDIVKHRRQILQRAFLKAEDDAERSCPAHYASAWSEEIQPRKSDARREAEEERARIKLEIDDLRRWLHRVPKTAQQTRDELVHDMMNSYADLGEADWELQTEHRKVLGQWMDPLKRREGATCKVIWLN